MRGMRIDDREVDGGMEIVMRCFECCLRPFSSSVLLGTLFCCRGVHRARGVHEWGDCFTIRASHLRYPPPRLHLEALPCHLKERIIHGKDAYFDGKPSVSDLWHCVRISRDDMSNQTSEMHHHS